MAKIELRHATIRMKDGFAGTALVNDVVIADGDTTLVIDTVSVNHKSGNPVIPVGARFTYAADTDATVYTVTGRVPADTTGPTTEITFSPALAAARVLPADDEELTFGAQQLDIKIGEGNLTYTEANNYEYDLDRGTLDTVREGDDIPLEVSTDFTYEFVTTGTSETITPMDAVRGDGAAAEWSSSSNDACEPYAVDIEVEHVPPCGGYEKEITLFPDFRADSKEFDLGGATISISGRCNATRPSYQRLTQ